MKRPWSSARTSRKRGSDREPMGSVRRSNFSRQRPLSVRIYGLRKAKTWSFILGGLRGSDREPHSSTLRIPGSQNIPQTGSV